MDYGKISYYKAEELEQRMTNGRFNAATVRRDAIQAGQTTVVATLKGKGLLTVRIEAAANIPTTVYAGGVDIGSGYGGYTISVAAGPGDITVLPQGGPAAATVTAAGWGVGLAQ